LLLIKLYFFFLKFVLLIIIFIYLYNINKNNIIQKMNYNKLIKYIYTIEQKILKVCLLELEEENSDIDLSTNLNYIFFQNKLNDIETKMNLLGINNYQYILIKKTHQNGGKHSSKNEYLNQISVLQQKIMYLMQQNQYLNTQLQQCNLNTKVNDIEKANLTDKLLFFDKSLEIVAHSISNNISNGMERINILNNYKSSNVNNTINEIKTNIN